MDPPDASTVLAPTTITVTHTGATPWDANGAVTCTKSGTNTATLAVGAAVVSDSGSGLNAKDRITFTVAAATSGADQAAIVFTCSTPSEFAAQPTAAVTTISATGVSSVDVTPSVAATYNSVTKMTAIDGDVDETTIGLTPSKIVLKATTTMAISNSGTITFTAGGSQSAIWTSGQTPTCTGTEASTAITTALISSTTSTSSITITIHSSETIAANTALVFTCSGDLAANHGTAATATTFTATSTSDTQQVAFGAGYVTTAAKQGALGIVVTQVSAVGADGTKPVSIVYTWTPDTSTVLVPTTITLTHTGATPWDANGAVTCTKSGTNAATLAVGAAVVSDSGSGLNAKDRITFTVAAATYGAGQAAIIFTCSTPSEFAAQPAVVTVISTTGISSTDATASTAATYSSVTAMTAIDGDVDETTVALTPSKIVLKATPTTEITASGTITFTAGGAQSAIWVTGQAPVCTGTKNGVAIADADLTDVASSTTTTSITITISNNAATAGHALVFTCVGHLAANVGTSNTATTFTATSTHDVQQVAFGAGYVTSEPQQGALRHRCDAGLGGWHGRHEAGVDRIYVDPGRQHSPRTDDNHGDAHGCDAVGRKRRGDVHEERNQHGNAGCWSRGRIRQRFRLER